VAERLRRYVQVVVTFGGVGSSPTECNTFFFVGFVHSSWAFCEVLAVFPELPHPSFMPQHLGSQKAPHEATRDKQNKGYGGTGIRARVERITTANANHYTIPPGMHAGCEQEATIGPGSCLLAKKSWSQPRGQTKSGGAGYRSLCLMHAKHALYHLSYTPTMCFNGDEAAQVPHNLCIPPA
jgi:hypothetical protein